MARKTAPAHDREKVAPATEKQLGGITGKGFMPGVSGNPLGRKLGSRNRLEESFLAEMLAAWQEHGRDAIKRVIADDPTAFVQLCAGLLPRQLQVEAETALYIISDRPMTAEEWE